MAYQAGNAFIQVVPSMDDFQSKIAAELKNLPDAKVKVKPDLDTVDLDRELAETSRKKPNINFEPKVDKAEAAKEGEEAGAAIADALKARIEAALAELPDVDFDANTTDVDLKIGEIRARLQELGDTDITPEFDEARLSAEVDAIAAEIEALKDNNEVDVDVRAQLETAFAELTGFRAEQEAEPVEIPVNLDVDSGKAVADAAAKGEEAGGAFGEAFRTKVGAAIKNLPVARIDGDDRPAMAKIAEVTAAMEALRNQKIGVDIDAGKALAEIDGLIAELRILGATHPDIDVRFNAQQAVAGLRSIRTETENSRKEFEAYPQSVAEAEQGLSNLAQGGHNWQAIAIGAGLATGVLGTAVATLPALLGGAAAAALPVALGMDGIKQAGQSALPILNQMKTALSGTFAAGLTPLIQSVASSFSTLTPQLQGVASGLINVVSAVTNSITSFSGMLAIRSILDQFTQALHGLVQPTADITQGLLQVADVGGGALRQMVPAIADFASQFRTFVQIGTQTGTLQAGISGLVQVFDSLLKLIPSFIQMQLAMTNAFGPTIAAAISTLTPLFSALAQVLNFIAPAINAVASVFQAFPSSLQGAIAGIVLFRLTMSLLGKDTSLFTGSMNLLKSGFDSVKSKAGEVGGAWTNLSTAIRGGGTAATEAAAETERLAAAETTTAAETQTAGAAATTAATEVEALGAAATTTAAEVETLAAAETTMAGGVANVGSAASESATAIEETGTAAEGTATSVEGAGTAAEEAGGGLAAMEGSALTAGAATEGVGAGAAVAEGGIAGAAGAAEGAVGGFGAVAGAAGGLFAALGGPAVLAVGGLTLGLSLLSSAQEKAAQDAQAHQTAVQSLTQALTASGGAVTANYTQIVATDKGFKDAADNASKLGISQQTLASTVANGGPAYQGLIDHLKQVETAGTSLVSSPGGIGFSQKMSADATSAANLISQLGPLADDVNKSKQAFDLQVQGLQAIGASFANGQQGAVAMSNAMSTLASTSASVSDQVTALDTVFDQLNGGTLTAQQATQKMNDSLRELPQTFKDAQTAAKGNTDALIAANGTIDTTTEAGSKLFTSVTQTASAMRASAQNAFVQAGGMNNVAAATAAANAVQDGAITKFEAAGQAAGLTATQAQQLADQYLGIPNSVGTDITMNGAPAAIQELNQVNQMIQGVKPNVPVTVNAITDDAKARLVAMGLTVTQIPGSKQISITAPTDQAKTSLDALVAYANSRTGKPMIDADPTQFNTDLNNAINTANAAQPDPKLKLDPNQFRTTLGTEIQTANGQTPTPQLFMNPAPANTTINTTTAAGNNAKPTGTFNLNPAPATGTINTTTAAGNAANPFGIFNMNNSPALTAVAGGVAAGNGANATGIFNMNPAPATAAVGGAVAAGNGASATGIFNINNNPALAGLGAYVAQGNGTSATGIFNANPAPANGIVQAWQGGANGTQATSHLNAESANADGRVRSWQGGADGTTATSHLNAEDSGAEGVLQGLYGEWNNKVITMTVQVNQVGAPAIPGHSFGGLVTKHGPIQRMAQGGIAGLMASPGMVLGGYEPGVDIIPAMLSPGEAVLVPELVRAIGPSAILRANSAASAGREGSKLGKSIMGFASGGVWDDRNYRPTMGTQLANYASAFTAPEHSLPQYANLDPGNDPFSLAWMTGMRTTAGQFADQSLIADSRTGAPGAFAANSAELLKNMATYKSAYSPNVAPTPADISSMSAALRKQAATINVYPRAEHSEEAIAAMVDRRLAFEARL